MKRRDNSFVSFQFLFTVSSLSLGTRHSVGHRDRTHRRATQAIDNGFQLSAMELHERQIAGKLY